MKTAVISGYGGLDKITTIETEKPHPKNNELLIKVEAFALNPKDILIRKGKFAKFSGNNFPQKIGFEFSGVVIQTFKDSQFIQGEKIFGMYNGWNGKCSTEFICIDENLVAKLPSNTSLHQASGISLVGQTCLQALRDLGKVNSNSNVCINGASGGVGTIAIQVAKSFGAKVTAITSDRNGDLCTSIGADYIIDYTNEDISKSELKFDIFFDVYGNYSFNKIAHLLNKKGIYITTVPKKDIFIQQFYNVFRTKKAKLVIVKSKQDDLNWLAENIENKQIKPIIDKVFAFEEIKKAQEYIETKRAKGKVVISIN